MKKTLLTSIVVAIILCIGNMGFAAEKAPQEIVDLANTEMIKLGSEPVIVNAVKAQNAKGTTLDQIEKIDEKWENAKETDDIVMAVTNNDCAKYLEGILESNPVLKDAEELYVIDRQGALVASIKYEEDYFWGEKQGFINAMKGNVHVSDFILDEDENEYMIHIMIPVRDGAQVIGTVDIGIEVED